MWWPGLGLRQFGSLEAFGLGYLTRGAGWLAGLVELDPEDVILVAVIRLLLLLLL